MDRLLRLAPLAVIMPVMVLLYVAHWPGSHDAGPPAPARPAEPSPRVDEPANPEPPGSDSGGRYALLIGVHAYDPGEFKDLPYPEADVADLAKALIAGGYRPENVRTLTASAALENPRLYPYGRNIRREVGLTLADRDPSDTVLLAFSGHGVQFAGDPEDDVYFCPADARLADRSSLVSLRDIYAEMKRCGAGLRLMLVDSCRDDPVAVTSRSFARIRLESVSRPQRLAAPGGVIALYGCSAGQRSFDYERDHGVFFHFVIAGLRGEAARDPALGVTVPDLESYVKRKVDDYVRARYGERQMPERVGNDRGLMAVAFPGRAPAATETRRPKVPAATAPPWKVALEQARALFAARDYEAMQRRADAALEIRPDLAEAVALRGYAHFMRGDLDRARLDADRAIALDPGLALGYSLRGWYAHATGEFRRAVEEFGAAIRLDPRDPVAHFNRGSSYARLGHHGLAIADYNEAIHLAPGLVEAHRQRGEAYAAMNLPDLARADFAEADRLAARPARR